jgi:hypothetical protein
MFDESPNAFAREPACRTHNDAGICMLVLFQRASQLCFTAVCITPHVGVQPKERKPPLLG